MSDLHWSEVTESAPQVPQGPAEETLPDKQSAEELKKTAPPPQSNPDPDFEQPQVADTARHRHPLVLGNRASQPAPTRPTSIRSRSSRTPTPSSAAISAERLQGGG